MKRKELLKSKEYWVVQIQNDLFSIIEDYMKKNKLNRTELAKKLGVTKGYITQILNGDFDHKISKLVELSLFSGKAPVLHLVDLEKYIKDDAESKTFIYNKDFKPVIYQTFIYPTRHDYLPIDYTNQSSIGSPSISFETKNSV